MNHRILLVRHGESIWNHCSKFTGWTNIPLTEKGRKEGIDIANTLREKAIVPNVFFSSVLDRSIDTADIIKNTLKSVDPTYTSWRLNEKHYGTLEGLPRNYIRNEFGDKYTDILRTNYYMRPPVIPKEAQVTNHTYKIFQNCYLDKVKNGESKENVLNRILPYFENDIMCTLNDGKKPIVVTHKHCIRVLMKHYLNLTDEEFEDYSIPSKAIIQMNFDENFDFVDYETLKIQQNLISS